MITLVVSLLGDDELRMRAAVEETDRTPGDIAQSMLSNGLRDAYRDRPVLRVGAYSCPVCASRDPNAFLRCNRPDCTDGRDPR